MSTRIAPDAARLDDSERRLWTGVRLGLAVVYGAGTVIHLALATWWPGVYRPFADDAHFGWVRDGWRDVFMANPSTWAILLALGEALIAVLLLTRPRLGYAAVCVFTVALALFGWGFLLWCGPVLAVVLTAMIREGRTR